MVVNSKIIFLVSSCDVDSDHIDSYYSIRDFTLGTQSTVVFHVKSVPCFICIFKKEY